MPSTIYPGNRLEAGIRALGQFRLQFLSLRNGICARDLQEFPFGNLYGIAVEPFLQQIIGAVDDGLLLRLRCDRRGLRSSSFTALGLDLNKKQVPEGPEI